MARRKPKPPIVILEQKGVEIVDIDPLGVGETPPATNSRESVRHVQLEGARVLLTVPSDSPIWGGSPPPARDTKRIEGAIVRLRPPVGTSDDAIEEIRGFFLKKGATKVVVLPRPRAELLPDKVVKAKAVGAREAVVALVEESNSKDKDALSKLCERVMGTVGL